MITKYYVYGSRVAGTKMQLEAIFNTDTAAKQYADGEKAKMTCCAGMDFFYNIVPVLIEE